MSVSPTFHPSVLLCVWCISPIFFELGIPNLVCECILGWRSVAYGRCPIPPLDQNVRTVYWNMRAVYPNKPSFQSNHVRSISLILFEVAIPYLVCECILGWRSVAYGGCLVPPLDLNVRTVYWNMRAVYPNKPSFQSNHVRSISLILFEVAILYLVCECILGWRSVAYGGCLIPPLDQNVRTVYSNIRAVYPNKHHVTTHPDY